MWFKYLPHITNVIFKNNVYLCTVWKFTGTKCRFVFTSIFDYLADPSGAGWGVEAGGLRIVAPKGTSGQRISDPFLEFSPFSDQKINHMPGRFQS